MRGYSENMKSGRPVNLYNYIFETLFDNVGFRQIIFSLFLIHNKEVKVKVKFQKRMYVVTNMHFRRLRILLEN